MPGDFSLELQKTIYDRLSADAALGALIEGVFDSVPEEQAFPYVCIGEGTISDWGAKTFQGVECTFTIHSWSRAQGRAEVKRIMNAIYNSLHEQRLSVEGAEMVLLRLEFGDTDLDPDGVTYHGVQRFRTLIKGVS